MKATDHGETAPDNLNHRRTLLTLSLGAFASQTSVRLCDPMLPQLASELNRSIGEVAYVITSFSIAYGLFQLIHGPMGDYAGKLRWIRYATIAAALASATCMLASTLPQLLLFRFIAGAACAALIPLSLAWIGDSVPYSARQAVLAQLMTGSTAGAVFGQVPGGVMADTIGWRLSFALPTLALIIVSILLVIESKSSNKVLKSVKALADWDVQTSATSHITSTTDQLTLTDSRGPRPTVSSIVTQFASVLRISWACVILTVVFLEGLFVYSAFAYVPSWLHIKYHLSLWQSGLAAAGFGVGGVCYSLAAHYLIRALGERGLLIGGSALFAIGMFFVGGRLWPIELVFCSMMGLGFFMVHNTLQVQATQMSPHARGTGIAAFAAGLFSGQSLGVALGSPVLGRFGFEILQVASAILFFVLGATVAYLLSIKHRLSTP